MQEDVPRITQRTAIIYTRCPHSSWTAGDLAASGATPTIRQTPALESLTGFASVSGGYSDSRIRISATPGGALEYTIYSANWGGKLSFDVTATTSGAVVSSGASTGWLPGSATYPVTVYVYGSDRPYLPQTFYEFRVGEKVDFTLSGTVVAPKLMEVAADGASMLNRAGIPAGLQVQMVGGDPPTGIRIFGTPEVPGIYTLGAIIRSAEGDPPHYALPFPPGEAEDLVIISIYGEAIAEGDPVVLVPAARSTGDDIRLVYHAASGAYIAEAATSLYIHSGSAWTATVNSSGGSTSERWTYTLAPTSGGQAWEWGVVYSASVGEGYPVSETLATAPGRELASGVWQEVPPKQGWTPTVILQGEESLYLTSATSGGYAGAYCLAGSASGAVVYEQEPLYTPQYSGWSRPPMIRNSSGAVIVARSGAFHAGQDAAALIVSGGIEVSPQTPSSAILPYCPPRCVDCGNGVKWSDPGWLIPTASGATVQAINVSGSDCAIRVNGSAGAGWGGRYPMRRLLPLFRSGGTATFSAAKVATSRTIHSSAGVNSSLSYYDDRGIPRDRVSGASIEVSSGYSATSAGVSRAFPLDGAVWSGKILVQEFGNGSASAGGDAGGSMLSQFGSRDFELREAYDVDSEWVIQQDRTIDITSAATGDLRTSSATGDGANVEAAIYYGDGRDCIDSGGRMFVAVGAGRATGQVGFGGDIVTSYVSSRYDHNGSSIASSGWTSTTSSAGAETFAFSIADLTPRVFTEAAPGFGGSMLISSGEYHGTMDCNGGGTIIHDGGYSRQVDGGLVYNATTRSAWYTEVTTTWHENPDPPGEGWEPYSTTVTSAGSSATGSAALTLWRDIPRVGSDSGFFASGAIGVSGSWIAKYTLYNETETEYRERAELNI